jgi:hypothetical protein
MTEQSEHLPFYDYLRSFPYRRKLYGERTQRLHAVTAREQWATLALLPPARTKAERERHAYWKEQVQLADSRGE